ncbi:DUF1090 domain-containing protein [Pseudomonas fulva]|nr:DUF1090 domain-containing protein [Pseudomonas fulva]MBF8778887.1 DUF1090 domain-containing protein [Pseudomonas fulva]
MKLLCTFTLPVLLAFTATPLLAAEQQPGLTGCAAKRQAIGEQLAQARLSADGQQVAALEKTLQEVSERCTEASLRKEREQKVLDARHEVAQRRKDLDKAMKKGDPQRIDKRKEKLAEANRQLQEAVKDLER